MELTKPELKYEVCATPEDGMTVIVVAAGSSTRMGTNKQLMTLVGIPVIIRTLLRFEASPFIRRIILVTRAEDLLGVQQLTDGYAISKLTDIVPGGADRHASVLCGLSRVGNDEKKVLIHDGARPLVSNFVIGNVVAALRENDAVICGVPICDTVKRADNGSITETVDRTNLYAIQTPQGIDVEKYRLACAGCDAALLTDDAAVMEKAGYAVRLVQGSPKNIKITTPDDIALAELYIKGA